MAFQMLILAKTIYGLILVQMVALKEFVETKSYSFMMSYTLTHLLVFCGPMVIIAKEDMRFWLGAAADRPTIPVFRTLPVMLTNSSALPAWDWVYVRRMSRSVKLRTFYCIHVCGYYLITLLVMHRYIMIPWLDHVVKWHKRPPKFLCAILGFWLWVPSKFSQGHSCYLIWIMIRSCS